MYYGQSSSLFHRLYPGRFAGQVNGAPMWSGGSPAGPWLLHRAVGGRSQLGALAVGAAASRAPPSGRVSGPPPARMPLPTHRNLRAAFQKVYAALRRSQELRIVDNFPTSPTRIRAQPPRSTRISCRLQAAPPPPPLAPPPLALRPAAGSPARLLPVCPCPPTETCVPLSRRCMPHFGALRSACALWIISQGTSPTRIRAQPPRSTGWRGLADHPSDSNWQNVPRPSELPQHHRTSLAPIPV
jgi:hypothetical protein